MRQAVLRCAPPALRPAIMAVALLSVASGRGLAAPAPATAAEPAPTLEANVALGCGYIESGNANGRWTGLTDGVKDSDVAPACYATDDGATFPKWVVIDLHRVYNVKQVNVYNSLNGNTKSVALYAGTASNKLTYLWKHQFPDRQLRTFQHQFPPMPVRYVKVAFEDTHQGGFGGDNRLYLREVEVIAQVREGEVRESVARSAVVVNFPRNLRLLRRLTLGRRFPLTVVVAGADTVAGESWTGPVTEALTAAFGYTPGETLSPRVVAGRIPQLGELSGYTSLVSTIKREEGDLVVLALRPEDSKGVDGVTLVSSLTALCSKLDGETECVTLVALLPAAAPATDSAASQTLTQLRAAIRQVSYLASVGFIDCENAVIAKPDKRAGLFDARGRLTQPGREFVAQTIAEALAQQGER